jgi:Ca2+-binding EF-hand superfamily protein
METERAALFDAADTDGDGRLSPDEFRTFEALVRHKMVQHFKEANGDGAAPPPFPTINADEHFKQLDTNGDGAVTLDELQAARPRLGAGLPPQF